MRTIGTRFVWLAGAALLGAALPASGQEPKPADTPPTAAAPAPAAPSGGGAPSAAPAPMPGTKPGATGKFETCKKTAQDKSLKGWDMIDDVQLCVEQARLDCLKQAIAEKTRGPKRGEFMKTCMTGGT